MDNKIVVSGDELIKHVSHGVETILDAVQSTLGPGGKTVAIVDPIMGVHVTKDGVTVARNLKLSNQVANGAITVIKDSSARTCDDAGDGTTTATVIACNIYRGSKKQIVNHANVTDLQRGINAAAKEVIESVKLLATPVTDGDLERVALISANGDKEIATSVSEVIREIGPDSLFNVVKGRSEGITHDVLKGWTWDRGYIHQAFAPTGVISWDDVDAYLVDAELESFAGIGTVMESSFKQGRGVVILAHDIPADILNQLAAMLKNNSKLRLTIIKAPYYGKNRTASLEDLAAVTGGRVVSNPVTMTYEDVGKIDSIRCTKSQTAIISKALTVEKAVQDRVDLITTQRDAQIKEAKADENITYDLEVYKKRLSAITNGVGTIYVGGATEAEVKERIDRVDDAKAATAAAISKGIVAGGGVTLLRVASQIDVHQLGLDNEDQVAGAKILLEAIKAPFAQIMNNVNINPALVEDKVLASDNVCYGYDAAKHEYVDMIERGIIDPALVTSKAVENAASAAIALVTTATFIVSEPRDPADPAANLPF